MTRYAEALERLLEAAARRPALGAEEAPLAVAAGRVCAEPVRAPGDLPRFDNSSMDGFAVAAARTARASRKHPLELPLAGIVAAGDAPACRPRPGLAWEIMTGAPIPAGCDAVVRIEDAERTSEGRVRLAAPAEAGDYVRRRGADLAKGSILARAGTRLGPGALLALAAAGIDRVAVRRRPRVAVIATGRELVSPGCEAGPGQVHDGSSTFLADALARLGAEGIGLVRVPDDPEAFARALRSARAGAPDLLVTTGAVSMGRYDFVTEALAGAGAETLFHGVDIRPGKPILAASLPGGPLVLGLPGNPVSTVVGLRFFGAAVLRLWLGLERERPVAAPLAAVVEKPEGLRCFFKARLEAARGALSARALPGQASFQVSPLLESNGWVVLPEAGSRVRAGAEVEAWSWLPEDPPFPAPGAAARPKAARAGRLARA